MPVTWVDLEEPFEDESQFLWMTGVEELLFLVLFDYSCEGEKFGQILLNNHNPGSDDSRYGT